MSSRPEPNELFNLQKFYCGHCPILPGAPAYDTTAQCRTHIELTHKIPHAKSVQGEDFYQGWQAFKKWDARQTVASANLKLPWRGDDNYGVDDFLTDIGDVPFEAHLKYEEDE